MILHVACLPFPTFQGTQAAISAMLEASASAGRSPELLTYSAAAYELHAPYAIHRIPDFPRVRSLRSGPSWGKLALDARCIIETRRLARRMRPEAIVAHHVEAALAALAARVAPVIYIAHTSLARELPVYFPSLPNKIVGSLAAAIERSIATQAAGMAAVAPSLSKLLGDDTGYLPVPWQLSDCSKPRKKDARGRLGLAMEAEIGLYAGNLDRYQGWEPLLEALAILQRSRPRARLLLATESDPAPALAEARRHRVAESLDIRRIDGERARADAHAASDFGWVPRRTEGGLPIKMLDAFSRALPVVAMKRATAALPIGEACIAVRDDDAEALAEGAQRLLEDVSLRAEIRDSAIAYLAREHSAAAFDTAMQALLD